MAFVFSVAHGLPYGAVTGRDVTKCRLSDLREALFQLLCVLAIPGNWRNKLLSQAIYEAQTELTRRIP